MVAPLGVISSRQCGRKGYCLAALASRQKDIADVRDSAEDGEETMPHEWEKLDDEVAAGAICVMPDWRTSWNTFAWTIHRIH
jgi:hypothetical protein